MAGFPTAVVTWMPTPLRAGAVEWYVDPDLGDDADPGTIGEPKQTIANAVGNAINGRGDQIHVKRGTLVTEPGFVINKSGFDAEFPLVIDTYGFGARPIRLDAGFSLSSAFREFILLRGFAFTTTGWTPGMVPAVQPALQIGADKDNITVEDCYSFGIDQVFSCNNGPTNITFRGNHFHYNRASSIFIDNTVGVLVEFNVFDNLETTVGTGAPHYLYLQANVLSNDIAVENNYFMREQGSWGNEIRTTGIHWRWNYHLDTLTTFGTGDFSDPTNPFAPNGFVDLLIQWNVCDQSRSSGRVAVLQNIGQGEFSDNLITRRLGGFNADICSIETQDGVGVSNFLFNRNRLVRSADDGILVSPGPHVKLTLDSNHLELIGDQRVIGESGTLDPDDFISSNNRYFTQAVGTDQFLWHNVAMDFEEFNAAVGDVGSTFELISYPDPLVRGQRYLDTVLDLPLGTSTINDVAVAVDAQSFTDGWNPAISPIRFQDYCRRGFGMPLQEPDSPLEVSGGSGMAAQLAMLRILFPDEDEFLEVTLGL